MKILSKYRLSVSDLQRDSDNFGEIQSIHSCGTGFRVLSEKMISGNGIYALSIDEEVYVKSLEFDPFEEAIRVISDNSSYALKLLPADTDRIRILGKIIGRFLFYW